MNPWFAEAERKLEIAMQNPDFCKLGNQVPFGRLVTSYADYKMTELMYKARIMHSLGIPLNTLGINVMMNKTEQASAPVKKTRQVLLNEENVSNCTIAAKGLFKAFTWGSTPEGHVYWEDIYQKLINRSQHGTSDGLPKETIQPKFREWHREATKDDMYRKDRDYWNPRHNAWYAAEPGTFDSNLRYQVPEDRVPTDEDAKGRPTVFARDNESDPWTKVALMRVWSESKDRYRFHCEILDEEDEYDNFEYCRFPYLDELDDNED